MKQVKKNESGACWAESCKNLERLNAAYEDICEINAECAKAMESCDDAAVERCLKESGEAYKKFAEVKKTLPKLKFDTRRGEYFFATDSESGKENFRILCRVEKIVDVTAKSEREALDEALRILEIEENDLDEMVNSEAVNVSQEVED